jgi:hypothetical protein
MLEVSRVEHFVGRDEHIVKIYQALQYDGSRKTAIVHGLGGMGKTQLVLAYEKRHRDEYSAVFWINSKNIDTLKQGSLAAASRIYREHPSLLHLRTVAEGSNLDDAVNAVKRWLSHSVTVMGRSRSRVAGLVLLSRFVEHLLPKLHHRYVMKVDPAAASLRGQHTEQNTIAEYMTYWQ